MENEIKKEIETQGDLYIKKVKEEMRANNLDISRIEEIINELEPKSLFTKFSKIDRALRKVTLATVLPVNFIEFYSGESFTKNFHKEYNKAIELLENSEIYRADEIIQKALSLFDKAGILSKLSSGAAYFNMKKKEALSNWDAIKKKIIEEKLHS